MDSYNVKFFLTNELSTFINLACDQTGVNVKSTQFHSVLLLL